MENECIEEKKETESSKTNSLLLILVLLVAYEPMSDLILLLVSFVI